MCWQPRGAVLILVVSRRWATLRPAALKAGAAVVVVVEVGARAGLEVEEANGVRTQKA